MQLNMRDSGVSWGCDGRILVLVTLEIKKILLSGVLDLTELWKIIF